MQSDFSVFNIVKALSKMSLMQLLQSGKLLNLRLDRLIGNQNQSANFSCKDWDDLRRESYFWKAFPSNLASISIKIVRNCKFCVSLYIIRIVKIDFFYGSVVNNLISFSVYWQTYTWANVPVFSDVAGVRTSHSEGLW